MTRSNRSQVAVAAVIMGAVVLAGCASKPPKPEFAHLVASRVESPDIVKVTVDADDALKILPEDKERLTQKVTSKIDERKAKNTAAAPAGDAHTYEVVLHLTHYDKGSNLARYILVGLGQIDIEGTVSVYQMPKHTPAGEFTLKKSHGWGGVYGGLTTIESIENTFADGVAATVTGQLEDTPKKKT